MECQHIQNIPLKKQNRKKQIERTTIKQKVDYKILPKIISHWALSQKVVPNLTQTLESYVFLLCYQWEIFWYTS